MTGARPDRRRAGFVLPAVLVILLALGLVGGAAALLTSTEVRVAGLTGIGHRAEAAAAAGLEHAVAHFGASGPTTGWPVGGEVDGFDYEVSIVADSFDFGSGRGAVHWSTGTGLNDAGDGQPVWVLTSRAQRGSWRAAEVLRLTASGLDLRIDSAIAAGGTFGLSGNATVSGVNVDENGHPVDPTDPSTSGACQENKAAFLVEDGDSVETKGSSDLDGNPTYAGNDPPYVVADPSATPATPEEVLGLPAGALDDYHRTPAEFAADPVDPLEGIVYITGDFGTAAGSGPSLDGSGILIVHNPLFDPREHDPSDPLYDPSRVADPRYAPATLGNKTGGTFRGLIVADRIDKFTGQAEIYGSVRTLSRTHESSLAGRALIQYSCAAVQLASRTITRPRRLSWVSGLEIAP
ncbi:MAG TPA: hypothetical protein VJP59_09995 [Gemmatimonadota bacterium]|nr:hypothetical protein [Gemmatimonadota bacterium]